MIKKRMLGRTGFNVTEVGLGCWPLGGREYGNISENKAIKVIQAYISNGGNFLDTAQLYNDSEERIGKALDKKYRELVYLSTKTLKGQIPESINEIKLDLEDSLRKLKTDYVDIFYLHLPPEDNETMYFALDQMERLKQEGKIRAIGASIKGGSVSKKTVELCKRYIDTGKVDVILIAYSILRQRTAEIFDYAKEKKVGLIARSVLESGFLTEKYKPGNVFEEGHRKRWNEKILKEIFEKVIYMGKFAIRRPYKTLVEVAINFALDNDAVSSVILGAESVDEILANFEAVSLPPIDQDIVERLKSEFNGKTERYNPSASPTMNNIQHRK
jgi:aryl-alcohol dehydrogenase-like predicted oxidoreductase